MSEWTCIADELRISCLLFCFHSSHRKSCSPWHSGFCEFLFQWVWKLPLLQFWSLENSSLYVVAMLMHILWVFKIFSYLLHLLPAHCYSVSLVTDTNNPTNLLILFSAHPVAHPDQRLPFILDISAVYQYFR